MSYNPLKNEDSLSELFSEINDSTIINNKLIENKNNLDSFIVWFDKSLKINRRNAIFFVRKNFNIFSNDVQNYINQFMNNKKSMEDFLDE